MTFQYFVNGTSTLCDHLVDGPLTQELFRQLPEKSKQAPLSSRPGFTSFHKPTVPYCSMSARLSVSKSGAPLTGHAKQR